MPFKKPSFWFAVVGFVLGTLLVIRMSAQAPPPGPSRKLPEKPFVRGIGASGIVEARQQNTSLGVPVAGLVTAVLATVWSEVEIGQALIQLDDRELRAQQLENQALVDLRRAQFDRASELYGRVKSLGDSGSISIDELRRREFDMKIAEADLAASHSSIARIAALIERLTVRSPIRGTVLQVNIRQGEYASTSPGNAVIVLGDIHDVWVRADIDEQVSSRLKPNMPATGYLKGDTLQPITMEFVRIEPLVIPKRSLTGASTERVDTRVLQVIYQFRNPSGRRVHAGQQMDLFIEDSPTLRTTE